MPITNPVDGAHSPTAFTRRRRKAMLPLAAAGMLTLGGVTVTTLMAQTRPSVTMAPATPVAIRSLT